MSYLVFSYKTLLGYEMNLIIIPYTNHTIQMHLGLIHLKKIGQDQVKKIIFDTKSCERDPISTTLLKNIPPGVLPTITKIISLSLQSGSFPRRWKTAVVTPLLKKQGMELVTSSYRPVSNLSYLSKLVKKLCSNR